MNCKPGDMAVIVAPKSTMRNLGKLVTVLSPSHEGPGWWWVESTSPAHLENRPATANFGSIEDHRLRPIRGDGITTEEVKELFSPSPAKESEKV